MDPPSVSSISRLLRGGGGMERKDDRKDYSIHGILGGKLITLHYQFLLKALSYRITYLYFVECGV